MAHCFEESRLAYDNGDGARAKQLSVEGHRHQAEMDRLNAQASDWIFYRTDIPSIPILKHLKMLCWHFLCTSP
jgi:Domain of unknown function (DUF1771)